MGMSQAQAARVAGALYVIQMATGVFGFAVRSSLSVRGDVSQTAENILAAERLFRVSVVTDMATRWPSSSWASDPPRSPTCCSSPATSLASSRSGGLPPRSFLSPQCRLSCGEPLRHNLQFISGHEHSSTTAEPSLVR